MLLTLLTCVQLETITNNIQKNVTLTQKQRTEIVTQIREAAPPTCWPMKRAEDPVTFIGDSITFANNWQAAFPERIVFNQGIPGDTTYNIALRVGAIQSTGAKTYIMMMGINDVWGNKFAAPGTADRILMIRDYLRSATGARVVVQSTLACTRSFCGSESLNKVNELNRLLKARVPKEDFLDINTVLSDRNGLKSIYTYDGIHLNADGYSIWQRKLRASGLL